MRVLIVSQYFWPENFRVNDLVKELVTRGHQVTVLTGVPNYPSGRLFANFREKPEAFSIFEGAQVIRAPMLLRGSGGLRLLLNYLSFVVGATVWGSWRLRGVSADVVFVFEPSPVTVGLPAVFIGKMKRAPVVFWVLDLWPETLAAIGVVRSPFVLGWVGHLVRFIYDRCALVLGQSQGFLVSISQYCSDKRKIRYFPSWAEDVFTEEVVVPAVEVPARTGTFNVMFAGNVGEAQDMPAVLDAAERLGHCDEIRWLIVGEGRKSEWMRGEIQRRGLQDKVLLLGSFPVERMPSFYAHADALLVSLKRNPVFSMTIPGKVQSYLMSGVPLVGMLDGEGAAVIRDAKAGLTCSAGDSAGLAQAVQQMAAMTKEQRRQWGENGRLYAEKEFARGLLMDRLEAFFLEAVTSQGAGKMKAESI